MSICCFEALNIPMCQLQRDRAVGATPCSFTEHESDPSRMQNLSHRLTALSARPGYCTSRGCLASCAGSASGCRRSLRSHGRPFPSAGHDAGGDSSEARGPSRRWVFRARAPLPRQTGAGPEEARGRGSGSWRLISNAPFGWTRPKRRNPAFRFPAVRCRGVQGRTPGQFFEWWASARGICRCCL